MAFQQTNLSVRLTVLMSVYNGAEYLTDALDSILSQKCPDFELIVIDDGSMDGSADLVAARTDPRVRLLRQSSNQGLAAALNMGLDQAAGEYVARMDADDISLPLRLDKQLAFMDANPDVGISGCWMEGFNDTSKSIWKSPLGDEEIRCNLLFESSIFHPTAIFRKAMLNQNSLRYDPNFSVAQDYEFWSRCGNYFKLANLNDVLLRYRIHDQSVGGQKRQQKLAMANRIRERLLKQLGLFPDPDEMKIHETLSRWEVFSDPGILDRAHAWLLRLQATNREQAIYAEPAFSAMLSQRWFHACEQSITLGMVAYRAWHDSPFKRYYRPAWLQRLPFWWRCLAGMG